MNDFGIPETLEQQVNAKVWEPDSVAALKVGVRVRYRISAECPYACSNCGNNLHYLERWEAKGTAYITAVHSGMVVHDRDGGCDTEVSNMGHHYALVIDGYAKGFWACAAELSILEDE